MKALTLLLILLSTLLFLHCDDDDDDANSDDYLQPDCEGLCEHFETCNINDPSCLVSCNEYFDREDWQHALACHDLHQDCPQFIECFESF